MVAVMVNSSGPLALGPRHSHGFVLGRSCGEDAASSELRNLKEQRGRRGETAEPSRLWMSEAGAERKEQNRSQLRTHGAKPPRRSHILPLAAARLREGAERCGAERCGAVRCGALERRVLSDAAAGEDMRSGRRRGGDVKVVL